MEEQRVELKKSKRMLIKVGIFEVILFLIASLFWYFFIKG